MHNNSLPLATGCNPACQGCAHRTLSAVESLERKDRWLEQALNDWKGQLNATVPVPEFRRWRYRDRVCLHASWESGWRLGLRRGEAIVPILDCPVHSPRVTRSARLLAPRMPAAKGFPLAYYVQAGGQVTLVIKTAAEPETGWLDVELKGALAGAGVQGLWLNCSPSAGRRLFAKRGWRLLWGQPRSRDALGLIHGPAAFQQLLPALYLQAMELAASHLAPGPDRSVVDLYCGRGASLQRWVSLGAPTIGVELDGEAVSCAADNAPAATVLRGGCAQRLPQLQTWVDRQGAGAMVAFLNPPRTGLEPDVALWLNAELRCRRIAYLSCSAGTLGRDLRRLAEGGFQVKRLVPFDFFPQTYHVEVLALLQR